MKLCTQNDQLFKMYGPEEGTRILKEAGYDLIDFSMDGLQRPDGALYVDNYRAIATKYKELAEANGLAYHQAHAPFPCYKEGDDAYNKRIYSEVLRSIEMAALAGSKIIVVHPVAFSDPKKQWEWNLEFYRGLIPLAEEHQIQIAIENMWGYDHKRDYIVPNVMSYGAELAAYYDELDSPWITVCLDVGHSCLIGEDPAEAIRTLGSKRLGALHIHDNDYKHDLHTIPYQGQMDWDAICQALGEIDYQGVFTLETDAFLEPFTVETMADAAKLVERVARSLMAKVDAARP